MQRYRILLLPLLLLTGCIQVDTVVQVKPDGSGTIVETVMMSHKVIEMTRELGEGLSKNGEKAVQKNAKPFGIADEKELEEKAAAFGPGVKFASAKPLTSDFGEGYAAIYDFTDVTRLRVQKKPQEPGSGPKSRDETETPIEFDFERLSGGGARLTIRGIAQPPAADAKKDTSAATAESSPPMPAEMMKKIFGGMRMQLGVEVAGTVTESNATHQDGNRVVLIDMDFEKILADESKAAILGTSKGPDDLESFRKLVENIPGLRAEFNETVTVQFKP